MNKPQVQPMMHRYHNDFDEQLRVCAGCVPFINEGVYDYLVSRRGSQYSYSFPAPLKQPAIKALEAL
jgi:hypothetical protein